MSRVNNSEYWIKKIRGNMERDKKHNTELKKQGWKVIRVWETDLKKRANKEIEKIVKVINAS